MIDFRHISSSAFLAAAMAVTMPVVAHAQASVPRKATLITAFEAEAPVYRNIGVANPYAVNNQDLRGSIVNMFEPLYYFNMADNKPVPMLATGYEYSPDYTSVTIKLRDGVKWSDGKPFTSEDVAFTLELLKSNGNGKKDLLKSADVAEIVSGAKAVDPLTVKVELKRPDPRFFRTFFMTHMDQGLYILPAHIWRDVQDPASFSNFDLQKGWPVTTGPWKVTRFNENQVFMDRRNDWWAAQTGFAEPPKVERVITIPGGTQDRMIQLITANQVDIVAGINVVNVLRQAMANNPKVRTFTGNQAPYGTLDWWPTSLYFNHKSGKWADINLRRAINHYIDRKQVIDVAFSGASEPKYDPFPGFPSLKPYIDAIRPIADKYGVGTFDKAKGDEYMRKAGYEKNSSGIWEKDGKPLTAVIDAISNLNASAPVVAQQLKNAGIDASFRSTPESRAIIRDGKYDLALFGHRGSTNDPYDTLRVYHSVNAYDVGRPTLNPARWSNKEYDAIVEQVAKLPPDDPKITELVKSAMEIWMREAVEAPINEWYHRIPMNETYWTGWPSTQDPYMLPASFYTSGTFGYILNRLKPTP